MPRIYLPSLIGVVCLFATALPSSALAREDIGEFLFTSDVHFGFFRGYFRGGANVRSEVVNEGMVQAMNQLPPEEFPADQGVQAGQPVGSIDFIAITGDIANREELYPINFQSATRSWEQFDRVYLHGITLKTAAGQPTPFFLVPGNHDVSNAIGYTAPMRPAKDATSMAEIYNLMLQPQTPLTKDTYDYAKDKILYSRDVAGVHCIFLTIWPETEQRAWIENDLRKVSADTPVFLFAHDMPDVDPKHLLNPNGDHGINGKDRFENLLADVCADGSTVKVTTDVEQHAFVAFLKQHKNIVAYFHGHENWTEFYTWTGPDHDIALSTFRSDSPMKGKDSGKDETKMAFQIVTFDSTAKKLTARECLWNTNKASDPAHPVVWGKSVTVSIAPRLN